MAHPQATPSGGLGCCLAGLYQHFFGQASRNQQSERKRKAWSLKPPTTEEEFRRLIGFLSEVPVFKRLPRAQYPKVARVLRARAWQPDETVLELGKPMTEFTLVAKGHATVQAGLDEEAVSEMLRPGDYFGEKLLEHGSARCSTVRITAGADLVTLSMTAEEFEQLGLRKHLHFPRRHALGRNGAIRKGNSGQHLGTKTEEQRQFIAEAVRANTNLRSLVDLKEEVVQQMCHAAEREVVCAGTEVVHRGEYGGMFYIVESGVFELRLDSAAGKPVTRSKSGIAAEALASEMRQRMHRKERFLQTLVHSKDNLGSEDGEQRPAAGSKQASGRGSPAKKDLFWRCNSFDVTPQSTVHRSTSVENCEDGWSANSSPKIQVDPSMQGLKPALFSPTNKQDSANQCFGRTAVLPNLLSREEGKLSAGISGSDVCERSPGEPMLGPTVEEGSEESPEDEEAADSWVKLDNNLLGVRCTGDSFGELALLYHAPRTSTAVARVDSAVWCVSQAAFRRIMWSKQQDRIERIVSHLRHVDLLQGLLSHESLELAHNFMTETFKKGDFIVHEGERQDVWYILVTGECTLLRMADGREQELATLRPPQYFGERALLRNAPSEFSVRVSSDDEVTCLVLDGPTFHELAGLLRNDAEFRHAVEDELLEFAEYKGGRNRKLVGFLPRLQEAQSSPGSRCSPIAGQDHTLRLDPRVDTRALDRIGVLGTGAFGVVTLERDPMTGQMFALKTLSKGLIVDNSLQDNVRSEREILTMIDSPFSIRLCATFKDESYLYFLFEPLLGGDIHTRMHQEPEVFRRVAVVKFILGCVVLALAHLHERNVVFRDLKPENILLDAGGYAKLCDYGFAKFLLGRTMTLCGTPEYMAPECIRHAGYDRMVDWWALGVLTFELLCGDTPFAAVDGDDSPELIFCNILTGIDALYFPFKSSSAVSFVRKLLKASPGHRLGIGGSSQVAAHRFLANIDFEALERMELEPPYKPPEYVPGGSRWRKNDYPPFVEYQDDGSGWDADF